jgi:hypothetical protein
MAVAVTPVRAPFDHRRSWVVLMLALFLGLLSLAAVVAAREVECQEEYITADDGVTRLTGDGVKLSTGRQQCQLALGNLRVALPPWVRAIWR